jgi:hypothetical protein
MGRRSRKRRPDDPGSVASVAPGESRRSRSRERDAEARAALVPLEPGERPGAVTVAAGVAAALALTNLVLYAIGTKIQGKSPGAGALLFTLVLGAAAVGMWRSRYWAVLGFQALLAILILLFALLLLRAANVEAVLLALAVIGLGGWLFWKLVRAMARIQMPRRLPGPGADPPKQQS